MANVKDLTGRRFGRLTALARTKNKHGSCYLWLCKCDCGKEVEVPTTFLTHGLRKSCGCLQAESRQVELTGKRFGRLTAIRRTGARKHNCFVWECLCDCGKTVFARSSSLVSGGTRSCGCLHDDTARQNVDGIWRPNVQDGTNVKIITSEKLYRNNTSGYKGVSWHWGRGMWQARIQFQGITYQLGYFADINRAIEARKAAEDKYFKTYLCSKNKEGS